jgi:ribosomal protein S12 methylthiotransferase
MLSELLRQAARIPKVEWIRILYAYPTMITDELIESIAQVDKVCNYLDLPLQHINNDILRSMNRRGTKAQIYALIEKLRKEIPELVLRTSLIVGYPGETEEQYHELIEFVKDIEFERLGVFKYSQEEDTPAGELANQIAPEVKEERYEKLMSIQRKISLRKNKNLEGKTLDVLIERYDEETGLVPVGRSRREAPEIDGNIYVSGKDVTPGKIVRVRITNAYEYDLVGETTEE